MDELSGHTVDLVDLVGAEARRLVERIRDAASWNDRSALVDRVLLRRLDEARPGPDPEVARARQRLVASGGAARSAGSPAGSAGATST